MKAGIILLKLSVVAVVMCFALSVALFSYGPDDVDPIEPEFIGMLCTALAVGGAGVLLWRRAHRIRPVIFVILCILYLLLVTIPALVGCYYFYCFLTMG